MRNAKQLHEGLSSLGLKIASDVSPVVAVVAPDPQTAVAFWRGLIEAGRVDTCHDISDGGLLAAVAEMAMGGAMGASIGTAGSLDAAAFWFGEDQARYVIAAPFAEADRIIEEARAAFIPVAALGKTGGDHLVLDDRDSISVAELSAAHEGWFPAYMAGQDTAATNQG